MGKTFTLTALALTAILGLGGGVFNMIKMGDVTAGQLVRLVGLVVPLSASLTLPVAALFSAASTYGRLSADNEFVACRSSGINMYVLFIPTIVLSLVSATVTFACINFVIPGMVRGLSDFIAADFPSLIRQRMSQPGGFRLDRGRRCYADRAEVDPNNTDRVVLTGVAYIEVNENDWVRFGTAGSVVLEVDRSGKTPMVGASMFDVTYFDRSKGQFADIGRQRFPPNELGDFNQLKLKFLRLGELFYYRSHIDEWYEVAEAMDSLRVQVGARRVFDSLADQWLNGGHRFVVSDIARTSEVAAASAVRFGDGSGLQLTDVTIEEHERGRVRTCRAARADVEIARGDTVDDTGVRVVAYDVRIDADGQTIERPKETFGPYDLPAGALAEVRAMSADALLTPQSGLTEGHPITRKQHAAAKVRGQTSRRIDSILSERFAFSASVLTLVILGAVLGIVFRGNHAIVSFGISFVPSLFVLVTVVTGKQMAQNQGTQIIGLATMWAGIAIVALLDAWTLTRVLRR